MSRAFYHFFVFCASFVLPSLATAEQPALQVIREQLETGSKPVRIVCLGDSITAIHYHTGGRRAWPEMLRIALQRIYPNAKLEIINSGRSGDDTNGGLKRFEQDVLAHHPDMVVVMYGMNDIVHTPIAQYQENLVKMVRLARDRGAAVILCSQNSIDDVAAERGRSTHKLAQCTAAIQNIGCDEGVSVTNCFKIFEAIRAGDLQAWQMMFSDAIHPNMEGHKRIAEEVAATISGKSVSLDDVGPPTPAMPKTLRLLAAGKPVKMAAMPPYDRLIPAALRKLFPQAQFEVSTWSPESQSMVDLLKAARKFRNQELDLVVIAVPVSVTAQDDDQYRRLYLEMMNEFLSAGFEKWDVVAFAPSLASVELSADALGRDQRLRRLIQGQDIATLVHKSSGKTPAADLLTKWFEEQALLATAKNP